MNLTTLAPVDLLCHLAVKGSALLALALAAGLFLGRLSAARRYLLWIATMTALAVLTATAPLLPPWRVLPRLQPASARTAPGSPTSEEKGQYSGMQALALETKAFHGVTVNDVPPPRRSIFDGTLLERMALTIWLIGTIALISKLLLGAMRLRRLEWHCRGEVSDSLQEAVARVAVTMGLCPPRLLLGASDCAPMVWGVIRPRLLLPSGAATWPFEKLDAVLLHELAHLARRDPAALWLTHAVQAVHWFNPLVWLVGWRLRADQERACDDMVLGRGVRASGYAQHLLDIARCQRIAPGLGFCALAMARSTPVEDRVMAILDPQRSRQPASHSWAGGLPLFCVVIAVPLAMAQNSEEGASLDQIQRERLAFKARFSPLRLTPSAEYRWKLFQSEGGLADLPDEAFAIESSLEGSGLPRTVCFNFRLPRQAATLWALSCPGDIWNLRDGHRKVTLRPLAAWVYDFADHKDDQYLLRNDRLPPAKGQNGAWGMRLKSSRHIGNCTAFLFGRADDTIQVNLSLRSSISIAN